MASFPFSHWNHCLGAMRDEPAGSTEKGLGREMPLERGLRSGSDVGASPRNALTRVGTASGEASGTDRYARTALTRPPVDASSRNRWGESPRDSECSASLRRLAPGVKRKLPTVEKRHQGSSRLRKEDISGCRSGVLVSTPPRHGHLTAANQPHTRNSRVRRAMRARGHERRVPGVRPAALCMRVASVASAGAIAGRVTVRQRPVS
jgi:hypothetical protein